MNFNNDKIYRLFDRLIRCLFPKHCPVCDDIIPVNKDYCSCSSEESKIIRKSFCHHCGCDIDMCVCNTGNTVQLPEIAAVYVYGGKARADILDFKFNNNKRLASKLGLAMAERCAVVYSDIDFDIVSFVPMSAESLSKRGYNQSKLLAECVGVKLFVPVEDLFEKTRNTLAQHELGGEERIENVKNSVRLKSDNSVKGKHILICDDVKTTGATLNQCVEALQNAGAEKICCICVAVTAFTK